MAGSSVDHLVSLTVFIAAMVIFISLFNQTLQTAVLYQHHRALATKTSDLLDTMLLSPGSDLEHGSYWGESDDPPVSFGLQDPELTQYNLSPFSLMRLNSSMGNPVYYSKTGEMYSNVTLGFGRSLLVPFSSAINYSLASELMGINGSYGFSLTLTPIVNVEVSKILDNPLSFSVSVTGSGSPLANAEVNYCLISADGQGIPPSYAIEYASGFTDNAGLAYINFNDFDGSQKSYSLIVYAHISSLIGVGYYTQPLNPEGSYIIPFISSFEGQVDLAHSWDILGGDDAAVHYNATFVVLGKDFALRQMPLGANSTGLLNSGTGQPYTTLTFDTTSPGILIVTYRKSAQETGVVVMPWGLCSLGFPITFGGHPTEQEWVATDIRQVLVNGVAYQAKLALWSFEGVQVIG